MAKSIVLPFCKTLPLIVALFLAACGGASPIGIVPPNGAAKPIDPSGNWTMTATDGGGKSVAFAALFSQTGSVVTSNSFTAAGNPAPFACVPFTANLANGQVLNVSNFTGDVAMGNNFGTFSFSTTLPADGKSATGTFTNMPPCTGLLTSGTFTGAEVPTTSGSWTGTLTPCAYDQQTGICTPIQGAAAGTLTAALSQDDATGNVTGTYQVTGLAGFSSGTVAVIPPSDILSGTLWQFTMTDVNSNKFIVCGGCTAGSAGLDLQGHLDALVFFGNNQYRLAASH